MVVLLNVTWRHRVVAVCVVPGATEWSPPCGTLAPPSGRLMSRVLAPPSGRLLLLNSGATEWSPFVNSGATEWSPVVNLGATEWSPPVNFVMGATEWSPFCFGFLMGATEWSPFEAFRAQAPPSGRLRRLCGRHRVVAPVMWSGLTE